MGEGMTARGSVYAWCGCRDLGTGRRLGSRCPRRGRRGHGSWYLSLEQPTQIDGGRRRVRRGGYPSSAHHHGLRAQFSDHGCLHLDCGVRLHRHAAEEGHDTIVGLAFGRAAAICGHRDVDAVEAPVSVRGDQEFLGRAIRREQELDSMPRSCQEGIPGEDDLAVVDFGRDAAHARYAEHERHLVLAARSRRWSCLASREHRHRRQPGVFRHRRAGHLRLSRRLRA